MLLYIHWHALLVPFMGSPYFLVDDYESIKNMDKTTTAIFFYSFFN